MSFYVRVQTNKRPFSVGEQWRRASLCSDTGLRFAFLSENKGEVKINLNGEVFSSSGIEAGKELVYPSEDAMIPVSAFNSINERSLLEFEFIPSDDAPKDAERLCSSMTLVYAPNDFEPEALSELELLLEMVGEPPRSHWVMTRMGIIHKSIRARTICLGKFYKGMFLSGMSQERIEDPQIQAFFCLIKKKASEQKALSHLERPRQG